MSDLKTRKAKTKSGKDVFLIEFNKAFEKLAYEGVHGFCIACGKVAYDQCEPDARGYLCDNCGERKVYGLEELALMGYVK